MADTRNALWAKITAYIKQNAGVSVVFLFLFVAGAAAGISMIQTAYRQPAASIIVNAPALLQANGIPWLSIFCLSFFTHVALAAMLMFSGLWLPACFLWPLSILLRGLVTGAGLGACVAAWPDIAGWLLLALLWVESAFLLPPMLRMCVVSGRSIRTRLHKGEAQEYVLLDYPAQFLRPAMGMLPCILIECVCMPLLLYGFC